MPKPRVHHEERDKTRDLLLYVASHSFYAFVQLMGPTIVYNFKDGAHIRLICDALQTAYETEDYRLMVNLPPGSCKSILCSVLYPAWVFGRSPHYQILHIGHTADFIAKFGAYIRDLMGTPEYQAIFPDTKINQDFQARDDWETTQRGVYRSAGAGGAIAGKRGHIGICGLDNNYVMLASGKPKLLRDVKVGDWIVGPNGIEQVTARVNRRHKVCYTINQEVDVSPEHPFLDYTTGQWIEAKDLQVRKTKLVVGDPLWKRIIKRCMKFGEVLRDAVA